MNDSLRRMRAGRRGRDAGVTLIEITVVMLVLSVLMMLVYTFLSEMQRNQVSISSRDFASGEAQSISDILSRQIHAATVPTGSSTSLVLAQANELKFYSSLGNANGPTEVDIFATRSCTGCSTYNLDETVTQPGPGPVYTGGTATVTTSVISSGFVPPTPSPVTDCPGSGTFVPGIFEYFNSPTLGGSCLPLSASSPHQLTTNQLGQVEHITVTITTLDPVRAPSSPTVTITLQVTLPNVDYYNETTTTT